MRKYKNKFTGEIVTETTLTIYEGNGWRIPESAIKNNEAWEEIKEKKPEYTILSFKSEIGNIFSLRKNGVYSYINENIGLSINELLSCKATIHSVRRESDGEVFTVGDGYQCGTISGFTLDEYGLFVDRQGMKKSSHIRLITKAKPKEWEVTGYVNKDNGKIVKYQGKYDAGIYEIYSVKRLSDGVEFRIGDKIRGKGKYNNLCTIEGFEITDSASSKMLIKTKERISNEEPFYDMCLSFATKAEKLFTTEDGVDIYKDDELWEVRENFELVNDKVYVYDKTGSQKTAYPKWKFFKNKEKAEEYILMNKPCLSVNDLKNTFDMFGNRGNNEIRLKELAKSKI